jgi:hypothetical protein
MVYREQVAMVENTVRTLGVNEERQIKVTFPLARSEIQTQEGTVHLEAATTDEGTGDTVPGNNSYLLPVQLTLRMPDLIVRNIQLSPSGMLYFSVVNIGNAPCEATASLLYLNGALVHRYNTPLLRPGAEKRHQYGGEKIIPGTQIVIVADYNADVQEASEENNRVQFTAK